MKKITSLLDEKNKFLILGCGFSGSFFAKTVRQLGCTALTSSRSENKDNLPSVETIRRIITEGRKFGTGICLVSQQPDRLDDTIISQCNSHIYLRLKNQNLNNHLKRIHFLSPHRLKVLFHRFHRYLKRDSMRCQLLQLGYIFHYKRRLFLQKANKSRSRSSYMNCRNSQ